MSSENKHYVTIFVAIDCVDDSQEPKVMEPNKCEQWQWVTLDELKNDHGPYRPLFSPLAKLVSSHDLRPVFASNVVVEE
ncbi:Nudix hydrolase 15, mitochondrial [Actinomortierella wolfii]|nr:Nudix hydrolase 15, mitochondrial [Actinomortierella wolfii]